MKKAIVAAITVTLGISLFACAPSPGTEVETAAASGDVFSALFSTAPEETPSVTPEASEFRIEFPPKPKRPCFGVGP